MIIRSISGPDIDHAMTMAMTATLHALVEEGLLDHKVALDWRDSHICMNITSDNLWHRIRRWIGMKEDDTISCPAVFKISTKKEVASDV